MKISGNAIGCTLAKCIIVADMSCILLRYARRVTMLIRDPLAGVEDVTTNGLDCVPPKCGGVLDLPGVVVAAACHAGRPPSLPADDERVLG